MNPQHLQHLVVQWLLRVAMNPQHLLMHVTIPGSILKGGAAAAELS